MSDESTIRWERRRRRDRHPDARRPEPVGEHDERRLRGLDARDGRPPRGRAGPDHRRVITSAKKTFFAGGDLNDLRRRPQGEREELAEFVREVKAQLRRLETLGKPGRRGDQRRRARRRPRDRLACHHRIVVDDPKAVRRLPRGPARPAARAPAASSAPCGMLGIVDALMERAAAGPARCARPRPRRSGSSTRSSPTREELIPAAKAWIAAQPRGGQQPWDVKGYKIPGGTPSTRRSRRTCRPSRRTCASSSRARTTRRRSTSWRPRSRARRSTSTRAIEIEGRYFVDLLTGQVAKNMIQAFFFDLQRVNGDRGRPEGDRAVRRPRRSSCSAPG